MLGVYISVNVYSLILARSSWSRKSENSSSPTLMAVPPNCRDISISLCPLSFDGMTFLRNHNLVTGLHTRCYPLAVPVESTWPYCKDLCLVELLHGGLGEEDAGRGLGLGLEALDQDAVEERGDGLD
jgi:hypothetical protein